MINVRINSAGRMLDDCCSLLDLMKAEGMAEKGGVAVAVNGKVVRRADWEMRMLTGGEDIIIINAAYGG